MAEIDFPDSDFGDQSDIFTRIDVGGVLESSRGVLKWFHDNVTSGTLGDPTIVNFKASVKLNITHGLDLSLDADGNKYHDVILRVEDPENGKAKWYLKDAYPFKIVDRYGRKGTWTVQGARPPAAGSGSGVLYGPTPYDRNSATQSPTWVFTGPKPGTASPDMGYADGGRYVANYGPYRVALLDENGVPVEYKGGSTTRLDPAAGGGNDGTDFWYPGPPQSGAARPPNAVYYDRQNPIANTHRLANYGALNFKFGGTGRSDLGALRCAIINMEFIGPNSSWHGPRFNGPNTYPNATEGQCLVDAGFSDDMALYGVYAHNAESDCFSAGARRLWMKKCTGRNASRDIIIIRQAFGVFIEECVFERAWSQLFDNEPPSQLQPFAKPSGWPYAPIAALDSIYMVDTVFGDGNAQQNVFLSGTNGDFARLFFKNVHSLASDLGTINKTVPTLFSGDILMGPDSANPGGVTSIGLKGDESLRKGKIIVIDCHFSVPVGGRPNNFANFKHVCDIWMDNPDATNVSVDGIVAYVDNAGIKVRSCRNWDAPNSRVGFYDIINGTSQRHATYDDLGDDPGALKRPGNPTHGDIWWASMTDFDDPYRGDFYWRDVDTLPIVPAPVTDEVPKQVTGLAVNVATPGFVGISWTQVTQNVDNSTANDLDYYEVRDVTTGETRLVDYPTHSLIWARSPGPHTFDVRVFDLAGQPGARSTQQSGTVTVPASPPADPSGFDQHFGTVPGTVIVTWDDDTEVDYWELSVGTGSPYTDLPNVTAPTVTLTDIFDEGSSLGWSLNVTAVNSAGSSNLVALGLNAWPAPEDIVFPEVRGRRRFGTIPVLTTTQRNQIANPKIGMVIINKSTDKIAWYNGSDWIGAG